MLGERNQKLEEEKERLSKARCNWGKDPCQDTLRLKEKERHFSNYGCGTDTREPFFFGLVTGAFPIPLSWTRVATGKSLEWRIPRYANYSCNYKSSRLTLLQLNLLPSMSIPVTIAPIEARTLGMYTATIPKTEATMRFITLQHWLLFLIYGQIYTRLQYGQGYTRRGACWFPGNPWPR